MNGEQGDSHKKSRNRLMLIIVIGIAIASLLISKYLLTSEDASSEKKSASVDELGQSGKEEVSTNKTSTQAVSSAASGGIQGSDSPKINSSGETEDLDTARRKTDAEIQHALTLSPAAEALKLQALDESVNMESRLKALSDLEVVKPRGFVTAMLGASYANSPLVKESAVAALGRSYFPQALQRLDVMVQDNTQHPSVREGILSAITSLAKAASENTLYPSAGSDAAKVVAETRAVLLKQLDSASKLRDGREIPTTIQILEALSYLRCPEVVAIIQAKLRESYADFPERDALVVAIGRTGFSEAGKVLEEYRNQLEEMLAKNSAANPMILQTLRSSLALVEETQKNLKTR